jgi:hypothetical protein
MSTRLKTALVRFGRVLLFGVVGVVITALPDLFASVPDAYQPIAAVVLTALITGLDKLRRYGSDPGEEV